MTTSDIIKCSLHERKMIHMHTHAIWHSEGCKVYALVRLTDIVHQNQMGGGCQLNLWRLSGPAWAFLSLFKKVRPLEKQTKQKIFPVFSYIKNEILKMKTTENQATTLIHVYQPAECWVVVLQSRCWNGGFIIMYMQRTSNSTRRGFHLPSDQFYECF